jgi:hypothetical protein
MKNAGHHGNTGLIQLAIRSFLNTSSFSVRCSVFGVTDLSSVSKRWLALMAGLVLLRYLNFQWMTQNTGKILRSSGALMVPEGASFLPILSSSRATVTFCKPSPMPESQTHRTFFSHYHIITLSHSLPAS